ncbi:ABC transporter ATP-binding protein [Streptomyces chumphonensis]|uniref:ABC transporter ATP-binding protein n=1 Tax=Streptomyces chumphonensis TaxID=1214925 RepID=A0A927IB40_9ACTN|nr:ABC transporter ATP-binding protein [Streptomyces chumphonensis]MBD3930465.1 ABC transporter ATP-binding protein [Streptomyces chumphonensis]
MTPDTTGGTATVEDTAAVRGAPAQPSAGPPTPRGRAEDGAPTGAQPTGDGAALRLLIAPVRGRLVAGAVCQALGSVAAVIPYICIGELALALLDPPVDRRRVWAVVTVAALALVARFVLIGAAGAISHIADADLSHHLRTRLAGHLGRLPLGWFGRRASGRVKTAVQDEVSALHTLVAHAANDFAGAAVTPVATLAYLFWVDWRLALVSMVPLVLFAAAYARITQGYGEQMRGYVGALGRINAAAVEFVRGIAVVKAFGQGRRAHARFLREADAFAEAFHDWTKPMLRPFALAMAAVSGPTMLLVLLGTGIGFVEAGWCEPVDLVPFLVLGIGLAGPLLNLEHSATSLQLARAAAGSLAGLLNTPTVPEPGTPRSPDGHRVELRGVTFGYDGRTPVLRGVDAVLEPGTVTALVGASGSGKSTLAGLLPRFADPDAGAVLIGGADVRDIPSDVLYGQVGFVLQDVGLPRVSLHDNIALARPGADRAQVVEAARAAHVHSVIEALPRGYDSVYGEDAHLSGGQAQRVTIARALLADTPVLVLDEATSWADPESEAAIQDALSRLAVGRTVLVIAHRLSSITGVDQILVLDDGRVVERGRHAELLAAGGRYARLWAARSVALPATADPDPLPSRPHAADPGPDATAPKE